MALASDLMGLGVQPLLAARTATAGNGPITMTAAGTNFATANRIKCNQFVVSVTNADGTKGVSLPTVGGDNGAFLADDFVINNATPSGTASLFIFASTGVVISLGGTLSNLTTLSSHQTLTAYPISTTQWVGILGS